MANPIDMERIKLESVLKNTYELFASWNSNFAIVEQAQPMRFRGSGVPHCPLHWAADSARKAPRVENRSFMLDFYSAHGSLVHALIQKWLGIVGAMFGRWKCSKCSKELPEDKSCKGLLGPIHHCGLPCEYVEYDMALPEFGFTGHCDGVLFLSNKYIPLEMKERHPSVLADVRKKNASKPANRLQCTSYRYVLPQMLAPTVKPDQWHDYTAVMYIDRTDIRKREVVIEPYDPILFEDEGRQVKRTRKIIQLKLWNRLHGICETKDDQPFCPYNHVCFCSNPMDAWEHLLPGISNPKRPEDIPEKYRRARS